MIKSIYDSHVVVEYAKDGWVHREVTPICSLCGSPMTTVRHIGKSVVCIWCYNASEEGEDVEV